MMAAGSVTKRRTWTRSRKGCKTCRIRHLKCDETYPACKRCTSTGRTCDGCAQPSAEWEVVTVPSISSSPDRRPNPARYDDKAEACFTFFQDRTVDYLAALVDQQWKPLVLRAAEQNNAIYHAVLAMGSMHRTIMSRQLLSTDLDDDMYAVKQYTRSLRMLASEPDTTVDAILAACILFIGFESLRRNYGVVLEHIKNGVRIIQRYQNDMLYSKEKGMIPLQRLIPAFARLERQLQELTGSPTPLIQGLANDQKAAGFFEYASPHPQPLPHFLSLNHAWISLHQRWHALISCVGGLHQDWFNHLGDVHLDSFNHQGPKPTLEHHTLELRRDFDLWSLGFEDLRTRLNDITPREASICALLQCHVLLADNVLGTASLPQGMLWDDYRDQFERIVELCRTVIENEVLESGALINTLSTPIVVQHRYAPNNEQGAPASLQDARCPLTFDMSVCMILAHVIMKCRDARIRLDAIKLFEDYPRLEGLWDGAIIVKLARAIDSVERQGASLEEAAARGASAAEIPLSQRVLHIRGIPSTQSRSADLILYKVKEDSERGAVPILSTLVW